MSELKPCPFCGGEPSAASVGGLNYIIFCSQCQQAKVDSNWYDGDLALTKASWNTRSPAIAREAIEEAVEHAEEVMRVDMGGMLLARSMIRKTLGAVGDYAGSIGNNEALNTIRGEQDND